MTDDCKELEKQAKGIEKDNPGEAIVLYRQASQCFAREDNIKSKNSNLERAAKLIRETAKLEDDPVVALNHYSESSAIYTKIGKKADAEKVMQEANEKFVRAAKLIGSEGSKLDDMFLAEQKFIQASEYAMRGKDEELSNKFWIESADQFYKAAKTIEDPREAFEIYKHAILNYRTGFEHEKEDLVMIEAAEKFNRNAATMYKTDKSIVLALDNFLQAHTIYKQINSKDKSQDVDKKIEEICDRIGMAREELIDFLETQGIHAISLLNSAYLPDPANKREIKPIKDDSVGFEEISEFDKILESDLLGTGLTDGSIMEIDLEDSKDAVAPESFQSSLIPAPIVTIEKREFLDLTEDLQNVHQSVESSPPEVVKKIEEKMDTDIMESAIPKNIDPPEVNFTAEDSLIIDEIDKMYEDEPVESLSPEPVEEIKESVTTGKIVQDLPEQVTTPEISPDLQDDITDIKDSEIPDQVIITEAFAELADDAELTMEDSLIIDKMYEDELVESLSPEAFGKIEESVETDKIEQDLPEKIIKPDISFDLADDVKLEAEDSLIIDETDKMDENETAESLSIEVDEQIEGNIDSDLIEQKISTPINQEEITYDSQDKIEFEPNTDDAIKERIKSELRQGRMSTPIEVSTEKTKKEEIDTLFDNALEESMEDFVSDFEDGFVIVEKGGKSIISGPIIDILKAQGYVSEGLSTEEELLQVPEYQILLMIIKNHPIPLEQIEAKSEISSISLVLSNLQADDLIMQTNDYQWTISKKVQDNITEFKGQKITQSSEESEIQKLRSQIVKNSKFEHEFISTMLKLGIVSNPDMSLTDLMEVPEFVIIRTIKDKEPINFEVIKDLLSTLPPVQVNRILSRLEADERISKNNDGLWELSDKLVLALVKNEI